MSEKYYSLTQLKSITRTEGNQWTGPYEIIHPDDLKKLKPADVRPVAQGEWIWLGDCSNEGLYCSACHAKIHTTKTPKKKLSNFCSNCGAIMTRGANDG